jgi:hypothetical protein
VSGFGLDAELGCKAKDRKAIPVDAEARKRRESGPGGKRMMTEALAGVDVADVDLDGGDFDRDQRIVKRDRGVRIAAGIDDDAGRFPGVSVVDEVDQFAFAIRLPAIGLEAVFGCSLSAQFLDVGERGMAVGFGLAGPQQIEVRTVEHVNRLGKAVGHPDPEKYGRVGRVIGNNGAKGKPLGRLPAASNASSDC